MFFQYSTAKILKIQTYIGYAFFATRSGEFTLCTTDEALRIDARLKLLTIQEPAKTGSEKVVAFQNGKFS